MIASALVNIMDLSLIVQEQLPVISVSPEIVIQILFAVLSSGLIVAVLNIIVNRKKTKSEAEQLVNNIMQETLESSRSWQAVLETRIKESDERARQAEEKARETARKLWELENALHQLSQAVRDKEIIIERQNNMLRQHRISLENQEGHIKSIEERISPE